VSVAGLYSSVLLSEKIALNVVVITGWDLKPCNLAGIALEENGRRAVMQLVILYSTCGRLHAFSLQFTRRRQFCTHLLNVNKYCLILLRLFDCFG
jgi:hypothetical protein